MSTLLFHLNPIKTTTNANAEYPGCLKAAVLGIYPSISVLRKLEAKRDQRKMQKKTQFVYTEHVFLHIFSHSQNHKGMQKNGCGSEGFTQDSRNPNRFAHVTCEENIIDTNASKWTTALILIHSSQKKTWPLCLSILMIINVRADAWVHAPVDVIWNQGLGKN